MREPPHTLDSRSEAETLQFAADMARSLPLGTVIALQGDLGAGKTRFVQGFTRELGIPAELVISPTFVIHQIYEGPPPVHHLDVYRLPHADSFWDLGGAEILAIEDGYVLIEWADKVLNALPDRYVHIRMELVDASTRRITWAWVGEA